MIDVNTPNAGAADVVIRLSVGLHSHPLTLLQAFTLAKRLDAAVREQAPNAYYSEPPIGSAADPSSSRPSSSRASSLQPGEPVAGDDIGAAPVDDFGQSDADMFRRGR
jgi:hypothetical protein